MNDNEGQLKQNTSLEMILLLFDSLGGIISLKLYWQKVRSCYKLLIDVNIPVKVDIKIRSIATLYSWPEAKPHNSRRRMRGATSSGDGEVGIPVTLVLWGDEWREKQREILRDVTLTKKAVVILPTGFDKTDTFQSSPSFHITLRYRFFWQQ